MLRVLFYMCVYSFMSKSGLTALSRLTAVQPLFFHKLFCNNAAIVFKF
jgi:hypothetical protein